jgi:hypothetical protein
VTTRSRHSHVLSKRAAALLGASLLLAVGAARPAPARAAAPAPVPPAPTVTSIPAAVQPLVAKIEALPVNSERYTESAEADGTVTVKVHGKRRKVKRHIAKEALGEASLSPLVGKLYKQGDSGQLASIGIGTTLFTYAPSIAHKDGGRPWVRLKGVSAAGLFPFHGGGAARLEVKAGGTGSYAELIDLLATADGNVSILGPATVDAQPTTELTAAVTPLALIKGASEKDVQELPEVLKLYVTEAGLPLRVVRTATLGPIAISETTDVIAENQPVTAKPPPARKTIGEAKFLKLLRGKNGTGGEAEGGGGTGFKI